MRKTNLGFTLIELIIVIGVMAILLAVIGTNYSGVRSRTSFENQMEEISADLMWTMSRSASQENSAQWGVHFTNSSGAGGDFYEIFYGDSYPGTISNRVDLHGSVAFSNPAPGAFEEIIFSKATGSPTASSTLELYSLNGPSTGTIEISIQGIIDTTLN